MNIDLLKKHSLELQTAQWITTAAQPICEKFWTLPGGRSGRNLHDGKPSIREGPLRRRGSAAKNTLKSRFAVSRFEITAEHWHHCILLGGCATGTGSGEDLEPVSSVSWQDAQAYTLWLSSNTGKDYRLLSEPVWEYAARAGTTGPFFWTRAGHRCLHENGADLSAKRVWPQWDSSECDDGNARVAKVASYLANNFGLHDTAGNVWELVQDCNTEQYLPETDKRQDDQTCTQKVLRGGSSFDRPKRLLSAHRSQIHLTVRNNDYGLRVARAL